jgi:hypothetical protein
MNKQVPVFALLAAALVLTACSSGSGLDDRLKMMESRITALEQTNAELKAQLSAAGQENRQAAGGLDDRGGGLDDRGGAAGLDDRSTGDGK